MPGEHPFRILRRVQSMTKVQSRSPSEESLTEGLSSGTYGSTKDLRSNGFNSFGSAKELKTISKRYGSGRMDGVFAAVKSFPVRTKSLSRLDSLPGDIPHGCLAVYVGSEKRRFVISTKYLSHPLFKALLKKCEEEFGFHHEGGLNITCDPVLFEHLLWLVGTNNPAAKTTQLEELLDIYPA